MSSKMNSRRREKEKLQSPTPSKSPTTAKDSFTSIPSPPFTPSSYKNTVLLFDWWLMKAENDVDGKRLAVCGFATRGSQATRVFTSAPIVKRYDAYTLETADGISVRIQGFINKERSHNNGVPPEVCNRFLIGFPYNWVYYADEYFRNETTSTSTPTFSSAVDGQSKHYHDTSDAITPLHLNEFPLGRILGVLSTCTDNAMGDLLTSDPSITVKKCHGSTSTNTMTHVPPDTESCRLATMKTNLQEEPLREHDTAKGDENYEDSMGCALTINHDAKDDKGGCAGETGCCSDDFLTDPIPGEDTTTNCNYNVSVDTSPNINTNYDSQPGTVSHMERKPQSEKVIHPKKDEHLLPSLILDSHNVDHLPNKGNLDGENTTNSAGLHMRDTTTGVLSKKEKTSHYKYCKERSTYSLRSQTHAEQSKLHIVGVSENLSVREDSDKKDSSSVTVKTTLPNQKAFSPAKQRSKLVETRANSEDRSYSRMNKSRRKVKDDQTMKSKVEVERKEDCRTKVRAKQSRQTTAQDLIGVENCTLVSSAQADTENCFGIQTSSVCTPLSTSEMHKRGDQPAGDQNESVKRPVLCSVKNAVHLDISIDVHSSINNASDTIGKRTAETQSDRAVSQSEDLELRQTKDKPNHTRGRTVWRPSYPHVLQSPLTRDQANKLSMVSPESLSLKRSRSGRLLVPRVVKGCQQIIYNGDGTIMGIAGMDVLSSSSKGSKSEPVRKKKCC